LNSKEDRAKEVCRSASLKRISSPPLVAAVLIAPKGVESPGSGRIGVICALVFFSN